MYQLYILIGWEANQSQIAAAEVQLKCEVDIRNYSIYICTPGYRYPSVLLITTLKDADDTRGAISTTIAIERPVVQIYYGLPII